MGNKIVSVVQLQELCAGIFGFGKACLVSLMVPWPQEQWAMFFGSSRGQVARACVFSHYIPGARSDPCWHALKSVFCLPSGASGSSGLLSISQGLGVFG